MKKEEKNVEGFKKVMVSMAKECGMTTECLKTLGALDGQINSEAPSATDSIPQETIERRDRIHHVQPQPPAE